MAKKVTTQDFIDRAHAIHGDKYGYAFSIYLSAHIKVFIHCPEHEMFKQSPANHLSGKGCPECVGLKKHTNGSFIEKAIEVHGENNYNYSKVDYINATTKIKIICPEHGEFEQGASSHLSGHGCPECVGVKKHTSESFIKKAREVHDNRFDYSKVEYKNNREKVVISCHEHGDFKQLPDNHLKGVGCPGCANHGFDRTKSASLYVLRSECGRYMKIGITNKPVQRHAQLSRATPFSFDCIELIEGPGEQIANLEKELLAEYQPAEFTETFDGYSEWRLWSESIRHKLISFMDKELTNGPL